MTKTENLTTNKMGTMPVGKLLLTMALPLVISMLVQAFYNIVDTYFVSMVSTDATGALSFAFPIQNLQIGFSTGIAVGVNSLLSKSLGEGNPDRANRAAGNGIVLMVIAVAVFMLFGAFGTKAYYSLFNVNEQTRQYGIDYTSICCIFTLGIFVEVLGERLLQASGRTIYTLFTQGTGAVLNIILDPLFIMGSSGLEAKFGIKLPFDLPAYGVAGAAIATVIGQWVAGIMAVIFNITKNPDVKFGLKYLKPEGYIVKKILSVGIPSIVMMCIGAVMNFCMNQVFLRFVPTHGQTPANVFGIYFKLQSLFLMPLFGINNASISIIAFNYGAGKPKRITGTLKCALVTDFVIMLLGVLVFQLFPDKLMGIFGSSGDEAARDLVKMGVTAMRIVCLHFPIAAVGISLGASFQALGVGIYSTITSLCRQLLALLPAAYLLSLTGSVDAVWWAFPIAEVVSALATLYFYARIYKQKIKPMTKEIKN
ncbi:MAG: MATE family efflux transporter [Oscillospiraceae bacterium]|nr:MATE family efflux transporter [Oscillospiraceae bacterium]